MRRAALAAILLLSCSPASAEFRRALPGYQYSFPRDHGAHPDFRTEWWYFTGNLADETGREFGYELTIFRHALSHPAEPDAPQSSLAASQVLLGHFAISDIEGRRHESWERLSRPGLGTGSFSTETLDVRLGTWRIAMETSGTMTLTAAGEDSAVDFRLAPERSPVIHGRDGVHQKSSEPGQASHYISFTRLETSGALTWRGRRFSVKGLSWMDHEFGSSQLGDEQVGWDWFALQLDSGEDLMLYQLRRRDGTAAPQSSGTLVLPDGTAEEIPATDFVLQPVGTWQSPETGATYPMGWTIAMPSRGAALKVTERFPEQEMRTERSTGTSYWEGAVAVEGTWQGRPARGRGYVELVGYAEEFEFLKGS